ncbi:MAG: prephenate dehydrogenase [Saprospiraceae bacterium]|jgi:prephenate dehydrogenase
MKVGIIGIGLIGGSLAKSLKSVGFSSEIIGFDNNKKHATTAIDLTLIDRLATVDEICEQADLILITIPVNAAKELIPTLLDKISNKQILIDFGSTKVGICEAVKNHRNRAQFVASHPIAGTENTGPDAAIDLLFKEKVCIICENELSAEISLKVASDMFDALAMRVLFMDAKEHDRHIAYVSHLSHISSFVLGKTVLEIEKDEKNIFNMAGSGFASTVRLAKSSPQMWAPIFAQNSEYLSIALDTYIENLQEFRRFLDSNNQDEMLQLMEKTNEIRRVLKGIEKKK